MTSLLSRLRFINVYQGRTMEAFLNGIGDNFEENSPIDKDLILRNKSKSKGQFDIYDIPMTVVDT